MKIVFTYASIILFFAFVHILAIFALAVVPAFIVYILYFFFFTIAAVYMRKKLFSHLLNDERAADGVVYFLLIVFPLVFYQLMSVTKKVNYSDITIVHWVIYGCMVGLAVAVLRLKLASNFISGIRAKHSGK